MMTDTTVKKSRVSWLIATFFGVGFLKPGPGTYASAVTVVCWWGASRFIAPAWLLPVAVVASVAITLAGIPPSTVVAPESGVEDPGFVVIAEGAGPMIDPTGPPLAWEELFSSFLLFCRV